MDNLSITAIWSFLTWLPNFILRRIFTKDRLSDLMLIDMRPRHDYCSVNLGETASYDLWIEFRNLSPFDVEIDRAEVKFHCAGTTHKSAILEKVQIEAGHVWVYYAQENIGDGQANHIAKNMDNHQSAIELVVEFNCSLHSFKHLTGRLEGVKPRFVNANQRVA